MKALLSYREYARYARQDAEHIAADCRIECFHASGPGGQGVNTSDTAVRMCHLPTGIAVTSRDSRSQFQNRAHCIEKIRAELRRRSIPPKQRHATRPTKASIQRRLDSKKMRSRVKTMRRRVEED